MSAPAAPTLVVANTGTGTTALATLIGDAGVTHRLYYRAAGTAAWTAGLTRVGNGTITQTGVTAGRWHFIAVSDNGEYSLPSPAADVMVVATATSILEQIRLALLDRLLELQAEGALAVVTSPKRYGIEAAYQDKEAVLRQADAMIYDPDGPPNSKGFPSAGYVAWHHRFFLHYWRRISSSSAASIDATFNAGVAAISDRLTDPARPFASPTFYVDVEEDVPVSSPDRSCDGRMLSLHVMYEHRAGDADSQT